MHTMKTRLKTETFENGDLSGDLENGGSNNARVNTQKRIHIFYKSASQPSYSQRILAQALKRHLSIKRKIACSLLVHA